MIGLYIRVSTTGQDLRSQRAELERWAKAQADEVAWYEDKATGTNLDRPGWQRLWQDCLSGKVSRIVIWRLDRLGRTARGLISLRDDLLARRIGLVSLRDSIDLDTPTGRLIFNVIASVAEYETEVRRERQQIGIEKAKAEGRFIGRKKGQTNKKTEQVRGSIIALNQAGKSKSEIARVVGVSRPTVYAVLGR